MSKKVLVITNLYEFNSFIDERRAVKLIINGKVEILSFWDDYIYHGNGKIQIPAILKLINPINFFQKKSYTNFSRSSIIKRDKSTCQYCCKLLSHKEITIDHVIPRRLGGKNSFNNCVVCCFNCNKIKGSRTPEQARMKLLRQPGIPNPKSITQLDGKDWHQDWDLYIKN